MRRVFLGSVVAVCAAFTAPSARPNDMPVADLALTQSAPAATAANENFVLTLTVTNGGPDDVPAIHLDGTLPSGAAFVSASSADLSCAGSGSAYTCDAGALANGASFTVSVTVAAPALTMPLAVMSSATVRIPSGMGTDGNAANDTASSATTIEPVDLGITKVAVVDPVSAGGALGYTIAVTNYSPVAAHDIVVSDPLPAGTTFVSANGTGWSCASTNGTLDCTRPMIASSAMRTPTVSVVLMAPSAPGTVTNTASVMATATDPSTANNSATATSTVTAASSGSADVSISASAPVEVDAGAMLVYRLAVANTGPDVAAGVRVVATLPANAPFVSADGAGWSCTRMETTLTCTPAGALATGMAAPITVTLTAPATAGTVGASFVVTSTTRDPNLADDTQSESTLVIDPSHPDEPPTVVVHGPLVTLEDTPVAIGNAVVLGDADSGADAVELELVGTSCVISLGSTTGLTFLVGDGVLDPELRVRGPLTTISSALATASVTTYRDYDGAATLALHLDDLGHTGTGSARTADGTLAIVVLPVDDLPTAAADDVTVNANVGTRIDVLANDAAGQPGQVLSIATVSAPTHGTTSIVDGFVLYTPALYYTGDDSFTYELTDGTVYSDGRVGVHVVPYSPPTSDRLGGGCSTAGHPDASLLALLLVYAIVPRRRNHSYCSRSATSTDVGA